MTDRHLKSYIRTEVRLAVQERVNIPAHQVIRDIARGYPEHLAEYVKDLYWQYRSTTEN